MESLIKWIVNVLHVLVPGLVYFADALFLLLSNSNKTLTNIMIDYKDYKFYIAILVILISYVLGLIIDQALRWFIWLLKPELKEKFSKRIKSIEEKYQKYAFYFHSLIMIRHLIISTFALGLLICWYLIKRENCELGLCFLIICQLFVIVMLFAYLHKRTQLKEIEKAIND